MGIFMWFIVIFIELDDGTIYMVKTMVSCRFSLKPIHGKLTHGFPVQIFSL